MGKKHLNRLVDSDSEDEDPEMDAEMQAVAAIMKEKKGFKRGEAVDSDKIIKSSSYNKEALLQSVEEMGTLAMPFAETYIVSGIDMNTVNELDGKDVELDDLEREMAFYNHSVAAVIAGRAQLDAAGIAHRRPLDFFCEHFKNDLHMARIKDRLLLEQKKIEGFEMRKAKENSKKYNKQLQEAAKAAKAEGKESNIKNFNAKEAEGDKKGGEKRKRDGDDSKPEKSLKRANIDKKYKIGGTKGSKLNDKKSLNDFSDYNPRGGKLNRRDAGGRGGSGGRGGRGGSGGRGGGRGGRGGDGGRGGRGSGRGGPGGRGGGGSGGSKRPGKSARDNKRGKH